MKDREAINDIVRGRTPDRELARENCHKQAGNKADKRQNTQVRRKVIIAVSAAVVVLALLVLGSNGVFKFQPDYTDPSPGGLDPGGNNPNPASPAPPAPAYISEVEVFGFHDGWFYFCYSPENGDISGGGLYRMRADGAGKTKVLEGEEIAGPVRFRLDFDGEWMYFANADDRFTLYKAHAGGAEKTKLNDDEFSFVSAIADGWVYYSLNSSADDRVYRIRTNGTDREVMSESSIWIVGIAGGSIYYQDYDDGKLCLYNMQVDGTEIVKVAVDLYTIRIMDGWIYYQSRLEASEYHLFRMRTDGTDKTELDNNLLYNAEAFFSGGYIYYAVSQDDVMKIRSVSMDGAGKTDLVCEDLSSIIAVEDGWVFYQSKSAMISEGDVSNWKEIQGKIYRIRTDGSEKQEIVF